MSLCIVWRLLFCWFWVLILVGLFALVLGRPDGNNGRRAGAGRSRFISRGRGGRFSGPALEIDLCRQLTIPARFLPPSFSHPQYLIIPLPTLPPLFFPTLQHYHTPAAPTEKLVENIDAVWDDGVAPEMALDFDCQHVDSTEGLLWWLGGFTFFAGLYQVVKATRPEDKKPCVNRIHNDMVVVGNPVTGKAPGSSNV